MAVALTTALGVVVAIVGLVVMVLGGRELRFAWHIYRGDPLAVADVVNNLGPVEVEGTARPDEGTVRSPFSESECLICEWEVEEKRHSSTQHGSNTYWETLDSGLQGGPFRLTDDTASCRVEPAGSIRHLEDQSVTVPGGVEPPEPIREFIASNPDVDFQDGAVDLKIAELNLGNDQRYVERRLDVGEDCYVYGAAHYDADAGSAAGDVNVRIDGDGAKRFVIADSREREVLRRELYSGLATTGLGVALLGISLLFAL